MLGMSGRQRMLKSSCDCYRFFSFRRLLAKKLSYC